MSEVAEAVVPGRGSCRSPLGARDATLTYSSNFLYFLYQAGTVIDISILGENAPCPKVNWCVRGSLRGPRVKNQSVKTCM